MIFPQRTFTKKVLFKHTPCSSSYPPRPSSFLRPTSLTWVVHPLTPLNANCKHPHHASSATAPITPAAPPTTATWATVSAPSCRALRLSLDSRSELGACSTTSGRPVTRWPHSQYLLRPCQIYVGLMTHQRWNHHHQCQLGLMHRGGPGGGEIHDARLRSVRLQGSPDSPSLVMTTPQPPTSPQPQPRPLGMMKALPTQKVVFVPSLQTIITDASSVTKKLSKGYRPIAVWQSDRGCSPSFQQCTCPCCWWNRCCRAIFAHRTQVPITGHQGFHWWPRGLDCRAWRGQIPWWWDRLTDLTKKTLTLFCLMLSLCCHLALSDHIPPNNVAFNMIQCGYSLTAIGGWNCQLLAVETRVYLQEIVLPILTVWSIES